MRIIDFEIKNLYGKYSFKSQLDEKVNIIVGNNGTFKSTILGFIRFLVHNGVEPTLLYQYAAMTLQDGIVVSSKPMTSQSEDGNTKTKLSITVSERIHSLAQYIL